MNKQPIAFLILTLFSPAFAGIEGTLTNHLYYQGGIGSINIEITEEFIGIGTLKLCLSNYDFSLGKYSSKCDSLLLTRNISINNQYSDSVQFSLENIPSSAYRIYLQLTYKMDGETKTRTDCDEGNFILVKNNGLCEQVVQELSGIKLELLAPMNASAGQELTALVNLTNYDQASQILLYSFIKNSTDYINEDLNDDSFKVLNITPGSNGIILMKNRIKENISQGIYEYIIKAESGTNAYQTSSSIQITIDETEELTECNLSCPECEELSCPILDCQEPEIINTTKREASKITAQLSLKRDEYYYIPTILIGIISLIIMYVKLK